MTATKSIKSTKGAHIMEFNELILQRRSVRAYKPGTSISEETLREIIEGARLAPSWKNLETARSYAAVTPDMISKARSCLASFNADRTENAGAILVTTFVKDTAGFTASRPDNEMGNLVGAYDLGLYNSYLMLKARDLGIDSLVMGLRDADKLRELFGIPENEQIMMVIALGYRNEEPALRPRKSVDEIAKFF